jgi:hypothetical protein
VKAGERRVWIALSTDEQLRFLGGEEKRQIAEPKRQSDADEPMNARVRCPGTKPNHGTEGVAGNNDCRGGMAAQEIGDRSFHVFPLLFPSTMFSTASSDPAEVEPQGCYPSLLQRIG